MSASSKIEWTDATWNPVRGCTKVSAGCKNCYAERFAERWRGIPGHPFEQGFDLRLVPEMLDAPLHWKKPRRIFVNSMSDLFHDDVPEWYIGKVLDIVRRCPQHTFQVLTKRARRMLDVVKWIELIWANSPIRPDTVLPPNLWLGVSVENQAVADERIPLLLQVPAAVRFLSCEPLLGPLDLSKYLLDIYYEGRAACRGVHWVIAGGESGPGARPMHIYWARRLRDQCKEAGVPFFFKQWGEWTDGQNCPGPGYASQIYCGEKWHACSDDWATEADDGPIHYRVGKTKAGNMLDGETHLAFPEPA